MLDAHESHVCVTLQDGRVLVAGGADSGGVTNMAEIYDPAVNSWTSMAGGMSEARSGATATLLQNGKVLIAGGVGNYGVVSSTAEIFDPNPPAGTNAFSLAGNLSMPRESHAAALLNDGRVLIVGGSNGTTPLATSDIYAPSTATITAGPALTTARQGLSATTLLNGLVLIAGGNNGSQDLASLELFDTSANSGAGGFSAPLDTSSNPVSLATARQGQQAILLPHNGSVSISGGTSSGVALASAELFTTSISSTGVWSYSDTATGAMTAPRSNFVASALSNGTPQSVNDGLLFAAGGKDASGSALSSTEFYSFPWVKADKADYAPGATATIIGGGFQPGEAVQLSLVESPVGDNDAPGPVVADANGNISAQVTIDTQDSGVRFYVTALGQSSGRQAQITFTDAMPCDPNCSGGGGSPILGVSKTHVNVSGNSWTWNITVSNIGTASATWHPTSMGTSVVVLQDDLPNSNISYGAISFSSTPGATGSLTCAIDINDTLTCSVVCPPLGLGCPQYTLQQSSSFTISFTATASTTGTYTNPRTSGICEADPNNAASGGSPTCSDAVTVGNATTFTLTYTAGAGGTISGTSPQTVNSGGSGTQVTAVPNPGYAFVQWSDGKTTASRTDTNVTANINVTATFVQTFTLTYTAGAGGTISGTSPQTVNSGGSGTQVTAVPNPGYAFVQWSDGKTTASRSDTNVTANINVTANFAANTTITRATVTPLYYKVSDGTTSATNPAPANCATVTVACQQYSDPVLLKATVTPVGTGTLLGTVTFKIGTTSATATTVASGVSLADAASGKQIAITLAPNSGYYVYAVFTSGNVYFPSSDNAASPPHLAVTQEDAQLTYSGQQYFTAFSTATSMSVTVVFTLQDATATATTNPIYDPWAGDITKAIPTATLTGIAPTGSYGSCTPNVVPVTAQPGTATITCTFSNVPVPGAYNLSATSGTGSYYSFVGDTSMAITTGNGGSGFITGGGFQTAAYLSAATTGGKYMDQGFLVPAPGTKMNFGFQAISKTNTKLNGGVNLIVRSACLRNIAGYTAHPGDDHLCVYQIKVSQGQLQSVTENLTTKPAYAQLTGSANIQDVTWPTPVSVAGRLSVILQMYDVADPGANQDTLAIQVTDNNYGLWFSNNWTGTMTFINPSAPQIQGGNLQAH
jgi:hypothetical protein